MHKRIVPYVHRYIWSRGLSHPAKEKGEGMNKVKASGLLAHHFWGEYSATIALEFEASAHAKDALRVLGDMWTVHEKVDNVLIFHGQREELTKVEQTLVKYGADSKKITSLAKSVDFGEPFTVEIPISSEEQGELFPNL